MSSVSEWFVYEFASGGGAYSLDSAVAPQGSLLAEGRAMVLAAAGDLAALKGVEYSDRQGGAGVVHLLADARLPSPSLPGCTIHRVDSAAAERERFMTLAARAAGTLVIAPEIGGALASRVEWVLEAGGRLLGPQPPLVRMASDKHRLAEWLRAAGVPAPRGQVIAPGETLPVDFPYPAVLKPLDGAGSWQVNRIDAWRPDARGLERHARLEAYCPGIAASVAVLCGPGQRVALPPCEQHLTGDGGFTYRGGALPLPGPLAERAERLALAAVDVLPEPRGYLGIDLTLGADARGRGDYVIEINPRLTTSYIGLRAAIAENLMARLLDVLAGRPARLSPPPRRVQFTAEGELRPD